VNTEAVLEEWLLKESDDGGGFRMTTDAWDALLPVVGGLLAAARAEALEEAARLVESAPGCDCPGCEVCRGEGLVERIRALKGEK
jgi:hypothetical protein